MASNSLGQIFRITTWGESHGKAIGVVIDGCPAGLPLSVEEVQNALLQRQPGNSPYTSPRKEPDLAEIYSGVFEGKTTGAPISIIIFNRDADSRPYEATKEMLRPGHANFTYLEKYGIFDHRGGGRASARETACRVAAGAVAKKLLAHFGIHLIAYIQEIGAVAISSRQLDTVRSHPLFCPDPVAGAQMIQVLEEAKAVGDSVGGIVEFCVEGLAPGLGDPVYEKLEANLAKAMLTLPATKGFEIGSGFEAARMRGSTHNDAFETTAEGRIITRTNHAGGTLGGITTGMPLIGRVAFKPPSSIRQPQATLDRTGTPCTLPAGERHDPCVAIRAVPVVEAMAALVVVDALLLQRSAKL